MAIDKLTQLALKAGKGDQLAMDELASKVMIIAKGIANRELWHHTDEDKEDLVQDIMCAFVKSLPKFDNKSSFNTWIDRVGINISISNHRKKKFRKRQVIELDQETYYEPNYDDYLECEQLFNHCTENQRQVMNLLLRGLSIAQVAYILDIHYEAVRNRQRNGIKRINYKLRLLENGYSNYTKQTNIA